MIKKSWRILWRAAAAFGALAVIGVIVVVLVLRFWITPDIERYKPNLATAISEATGLTARVGRVGAHWEGLRPVVTLEAIEFIDAQGRSVLGFDRIEGMLSWWSVPALKPQFAALEILHPNLVVRRDAQGRWFVAGVALNDQPAGGPGFSDWLLNQAQISIRNAKVEWQDELRATPPLALTDVDLTLENHGSYHKFGLRGTPPRSLATTLLLAGELNGADPQRWNEWRGSLYAQTEGANLTVLNQYLPFSHKLKSGTGSVKAWVDFAAGHVSDVVTELDLRDVNARLREDLQPLSLSMLSGRVSYTEQDAQRTIALRGVKGEFSSPKWRLPATDLDLNFSKLDASGPVALRASQIDLSALAALSMALPLPETERERLQRWAPTGVLSTVDASWQPQAAGASAFTLRAKFRDLGWRASDYVPGAQGLAGSVDATQAGGAFSLESNKSALDFPKVFEHALQFDKLSGQANWKRVGGQYLFTIQNVSFANSDGAGTAFGTYKTDFPAAGSAAETGTTAPAANEIAANAETNAAAPPNKRMRHPGIIDLTAKISRGRGEHIERYVPLVLSKNVRDWLDKAIVAGRSNDATLRLRGDLYEFPFIDDKHGIFDLTARIEDVTLWYADGWPKIEHGKALLNFRGARMEVRDAQGTVLGARIERGQAIIPQLGNHAERVQITGEASGAFQDALAFIDQSPLRSRFNNRTTGTRGSGNGKLKLSLDIPIREPARAIVAGEYQFNNNTLDDAAGSLPALSQITGAIDFTERNVSSKQLRAVAFGAPMSLELRPRELGVDILARGEADLSRLQNDYPHALLKELRGRARWEGTLRLGEGASDLNIKAQADLFGAPATAAITREADGALRIEARGSAKREELTKALPQIDWQLIDNVGEWKAKVDVKQAQTDVDLRADATVLGRPATITVAGAAQNLHVSAQGRIDPQRLNQLYPHALFARLSGETNWRAEMAMGKENTNVRLVSDLRGLAAALPAPLGKSAAEALPLQIDITPAGENRDTVRIALGDRLTARMSRTRDSAGKRAIQGVSVRFGGEAPAQQGSGINVSGTMQELDLSQWLELQRGGKSAADGGSAGPAINTVDVTARRFVALGRVFDAVAVQVRPRVDGGLRVGLSGEQILGAVEWLPPGQTGGERVSSTGKIFGRFERLLLPTTLAVADPAAAGKVALRPGEYPALDFSAQQFQIGQRRLGTLSLTASPEGNTWRINHLGLVSAAATLSATGLWSGVNDQPGTGMTATWSINDLGGLMDEMGYAGTIAGGKGEIKGQLSWRGAPFDFSATTLGGEIKLRADDGRFLKIEPGAGKLLSLISLQALPRRITLDFRDVFSEGFAFDSISARVSVAEGLMRTDNFEMKGTGARVSMTGEADVRSETQKLRVKVRPAMGGTVAVAGTIAGGPIAGVGAYVLQKILKQPLDELLSYEYDVTGTWADPQVQKVVRPQPPERPRPR